MAWASPEFSASRVDRAGEMLVDAKTTQSQLEWAFGAINNWRSSHSFPLNTFQTGLRKKARKLDAGAVVAQRLKRLSSIALKLVNIPGMKLSRMQDIGGCRAIVGNVAKVRELRELYKESAFKHKLAREDDYIGAPKESGYRGVHLVYRYFSDRNATYNGLRIEMQLRTRLQHAWATAVETVGTFLQQALKSSQGEEQWLRFFALMGSALAVRERTALVPGTPTHRRELGTELREMSRSLQVESKLSHYGHALQTLEIAQEKHEIFLLELDPAQQQTIVTGYRWQESEQAASDYLKAEKRVSGKPGAEAVLVSVESVAALKSAYPNYFLDTRLFIEALRRASAALPA